MSISNLLLDVKTSFKFKLQENLLAIVSLKFNDEIIIRFCRITLRSDNTLWLQPPSIKELSYAKCFIIDPLDKWKEFEHYVINMFLLELYKKVEEGEYSLPKYNLIKEVFLKPKEDIDLDDIPF